MNKFFPLIVLLLSAIACEQHLDADAIIKKSIERHGGEDYKDLNVHFTFREDDYSIKINKGWYTYQKFSTDSLGNMYQSILNNDGFVYKKNGKVYQLDSLKAFQTQEQVNSVAYFALLPYGLNNAAVYKKKLGEYQVGDNQYYVIKVTFDELGGGTDYQDIFYYWINQKDFKMDYLAYVYQTNGGGVRIRKVKERHQIDGVIFQNYNNYKLKNKDYSFENILQSIQNNQLIKVSEINLEW